MIRVVLLAVLLVPRSAFAACETILATDSSKVSKAGDTMTGSLTNNYGFIGSLTGNVTGNCSGNAGTVTNGVYTTGSYSDPAWITSLNGSKLTAGSVDTTKIGSGAVTVNAIASGAVDTDKIGSGAITVNKMAASAVDTSKIAAGAVDTTKAKCLNGTGCFLTTDSSGRYPPLDGSQITGISGVLSGLTSGFVPRASGATSIVNGNVWECSTCTVNLQAVQHSTWAYGSMVYSTWTYIPAQTVTQSNCDVCQATVAFVSNGGSYLFQHFGMVTNNSTQSNLVTFKVDGQFIGNEGRTKGAPGSGVNTPAAGSCTPDPAEDEAVIAAGFHWACISFCTTSGTNLQVLGNSTTCSASFTSPNRFKVRWAGY